MEEVGVSRTRGISAVQAYDVEILVFHPDAAQEAALAGIFLGGDVEDDAAHVALKFAMNIFELVMSAVKVLAIGENHPGKADGLVLELEQLGESAHHAGLKARIFRKIVLPVDRIAQVQAAQEIVVFLGRRTHLLVELQVLQIGLDQWSARLQHRDQGVLAFNRPVNHLVHRGHRRSCRCGRGGNSGGLRRTRGSGGWRVRRG